ncbi:MAG: hypothetical protein H0T79_17295 [Deltaproteobacteria bacterium]|nr:hypothetical protein [Deltaproteobacteria bacterium]
MRSLVATVIALSAITGCDLYWDDGGDDDVACKPPYDYGYGSGAAQEYRNPDTGLCQQIGGGYDCYDSCGQPCYGGAGSGATDAGSPEPGGGNGSGGAALAWPVCYGSCTGLDAYSCEATAGCHAAYLDNEYDDLGSRFWACFDIAPLPVTNDAYCTGLSAYGCTVAENCESHYIGEGYDAATKFAYCAPETGGSVCDTTDCGFGSHCEEQCYPCDTTDGTACPLYCSPMCVPDEPYTCANVDCGPNYTCVEQCDGGGGGGMTGTGAPDDPSPPPPGYCYPTCIEVVNAPGECYGDVWCDALPPACPATTTPGILNGCYSGYCIPVAQCGPQDPGSCQPATATCTVAPPACPTGTTAGTQEGCYTGYCIPDGSCPQLPCEALTDEAACTGRMECSAVFTGQGCTCTPSGCTCTSQTFDHCETL